MQLQLTGVQAGGDAHEYAIKIEPSGDMGPTSEWRQYSVVGSQNKDGPQANPWPPLHAPRGTAALPQPWPQMFVGPPQPLNAFTHWMPVPPSGQAHWY
jgi:hypothetical protein